MSDIEADVEVEEKPVETITKPKSKRGRKPKIVPDQDLMKKLKMHREFSKLGIELPFPRELVEMVPEGFQISIGPARKKPTLTEEMRKKKAEQMIKNIHEPRRAKQKQEMEVLATKDSDEEEEGF